MTKKARADRYYLQYGPVVYRRCLQLLGDKQAAHDATRDVFLELLCQADRFEEPATALGWVYAIATAFCLEVLEAARPARATLVGGSPAPNSRADAPAGTVTAPPMAHVLIIEDDRDIRDTLSHVLESEGHRVVRASNGAEGLAAARSCRPDLILLDLMMPVMDGWAFRDAQRLDVTIRNVPVVVVSASARPREIEAAAFLRKPCSLDDLMSAVHHFASSDATQAGGWRAAGHAG